MSRQTGWIAALVAAVAVVAAGAGAYLYLQTRAPAGVFAACGGGKAAVGAIGGPFTLIDGRGRTVTDRQVITLPSLIYFGYTSCPDVCPLDNARNAAATDILAKRGYEVQPVFISVDPKRDTPAVVGKYAAGFGPRMIGLTGTPQEVKAAAQAYTAYYKVQDPRVADYMIDHSTFTYLVFPKTGFVDFFRREDTPEGIADRVACFIDHEKAN